MADSTAAWQHSDIFVRKALDHFPTNVDGRTIAARLTAEGSTGATMFSDNETAVDLLGFDDQVVDLCDIVSDRTLLPVTVGLLGDWGSGKSSLLKMAADRLRSGGSLVVEFSPWRIEQYDDVKSAFLDAVVSAVEAALGPEKPEQDGKVKAAFAAVRQLHKKVRWMRVAGLAAKHLVTMTAPTLEELDGLLVKDAGTPVATTASVARDFHDEFRDLVSNLEQAIVVLVDDLDRCLPEQVLDVLQAIRLFLAVPGTAFVLATDERVVRDAVRIRYPQATTTSETDLPQEYLEKIIQIPIRIPPLGPGQIETYLNLLVAEKHCDADQVARLRSRAADARAQEYLAVAMNLGIARDTLAPAALPEGAERDFEIVSRTARLLAMGLKGNPRQVKRFLNMLFLRRSTAKRRNLDIDDAVLAKLAVLEYAHLRYFQTLHRWQLQSEGAPPEIGQAEQVVAGKTPEEVSPEVTEWVTNPWLKTWLQIDPPLDGVDLASYFVLAREALDVAAVSARRLPAELQKLLESLASPSVTQRAVAVQTARDLPGEELLAIVEAAVERLPSMEAPAPMALSLLDAVAGRENFMRAVVGGLGSLPYQRLTAAFPTQLQQALAELAPALMPDLLRAWEKQSTNPKLSKAAAQLRRELAKDS
jgi:hypothetical protein